jgi:hypothetical protein
MPNTVHHELHEVIGTYLHSGGDLSNYTLSSTVAANRRPDINETAVRDEDCGTILNSLTSKLYCQRYLSGAGAARVFVKDQADIIPLSGSRPYWNQYTGGVWQQTLFNNNEYGAIFVFGLPVSSDANSQKYRFVFVQPQIVSTSLSTIQAVSPNSYTYGTSLLPEFVAFAKIIVQYTSSDWVITQVDKLTGTRFSQSSTAGGSFLTVVSTDSTLSGHGTPGSPLSVNRIYPNVYSLASGSTITINIDTYTDADITALAAAATFAAPTGTPRNKQRLMVDIKDNGTARGLTWNAIFASGGATLPTTTILGKQMSLVFIYDSTAAKWYLRSLSQNP